MPVNIFRPDKGIVDHFNYNVVPRALHKNDGETSVWAIFAEDW